MTGKRSARLAVPGIAHGAVVGGSCCVISADDAVQRELDSWPGVSTMRINAETGVVELELDEDAPAVADLAESLASLGLPAIPC